MQGKGGFVSLPLADQFAAHVECVPFHPCWEWNGTIFPDGYGNVMFQRKNLRAHRVAYRLYRGAIPPKLLVCHSCDNRSCVNPDHLFLGTIADNSRDRQSKGRKGRIGRTTFKLHDHLIPDILRRRAEGESYHSIARRYGVTHTALIRRLARLPKT